jgi:DNA-binding MarR family transcriptional regulator
MLGMADPRPAAGQLPLLALMSQALVAFTIEFDNEFEHQMPHRTTNHGSTAGSERAPWLVSMAMWVHCMRHVPADGIPAGELARRAQLSAKGAEMLLKRMSKWWGYLTIKPDPADSRVKPPPSAWLVRPTPAGRQAQHIWEPLTGVVEDRWRLRFGAEEIDQLRGALAAVVGHLDPELPDYPPVGRLDSLISPAPPWGPDRAASDLPLMALLSKVLLAFTVDFERRPDPTLRLSANALRVLDDQGVRVRDLPALTGISEMGIDNSLSTLDKGGYVAVGVDPAVGRAKLARLTAKGRQAQGSYRQRTGEIEHDWETRFGKQAVAVVRGSLEALSGGGTSRDSPLFAGLEPYPEGWRSQIARPDTLPHYPMVSHRGGFPDGS